MYSLEISIFIVSFFIFIIHSFLFFSPAFFTSLFSPAQNLGEAVIKSVNDRVGSLISFARRKEAKEDDEAATKQALSICRQCLVDIRSNDLLLSGLVWRLCSLHLDICSSTAQLLSALHSSPDKAHAWYGRGISIADTIAEESDCLRLYNVLAPPDLKEIVDNINQATVQMLEIQPDFSVSLSKMS